MVCPSDCSPPAPLFHCFVPAKLQDLRQFEFGSNFACYPPFPPRNILFAGFRSSAGKSSRQNIEFMTKIHLEDPFLALDLKLRRVRGGEVYTCSENHLKPFAQVITTKRQYSAPTTSNSLFQMLQILIKQKFQFILVAFVRAFSRVFQCWWHQIIFMG